MPDQVDPTMSQPDTNADDLRAKVFENRVKPGDWHVEKMGAAGVVEVAVFGGPNARERALRYAAWEYGGFDEIEPEPYPSIGGPSA
jgi:hypothetical protein